MSTEELEVNRAPEKREVLRGFSRAALLECLKGSDFLAGLGMENFRKEVKNEN